VHCSGLGANIAKKEKYCWSQGEMMSIYQLGEDKPDVPASAYVAREATVIGKVTLGEQVSIWPAAVIRGDNDKIQIGAASNVQDGAVLHVDRGYPLTIGADVTIGHQAMLHGCTVGDGSLIGIQAVIMNGVVIGKDCLVGAAALLPEGKVFGDRQLIFGSPAKVVRELSDEDVAGMRRAAAGYVRRQEMYKEKLKKLG
jgi:carbonic anhydrase/acetyltransferase-like protein (isoleucine patch superfamily)